MLSVKVMENPRHSSKSFMRVDHHNLRRLKLLSRHKLPLEVLWMNPHHHTHLVKLIILHKRLEIPGINKVHCINLSMLLVCSLCF